MPGCKVGQWVFGTLVAYMVLSMVAFLPIWFYSRAWDYSSSGRISVVLVVFVVLKMTHRI